MKSNNKIIQSLIWKFLEKGGVQGIQFGVQIILARVLSPVDYGVIAIVTIFISLSNVFIQSGFNMALIQKKKIDSMDLSSVFYTSLLLASFIYLILFLGSPFISSFYNNDLLKNIFRVLGITLFLGAYNSIQNALLIREMDFKKLFLVNFFSTIISGVTSIILVYKNYGIWTLVYQQLINQLLVTVLLYYFTKWKPCLKFSIERVKNIFDFGGKILFSSLLDTLYMNLRSLVIGKNYSASTLAFYNRGDQFPQLIVSNFNGSIQAVLFPSLVKEQDNKIRIKEMVRRAIVTSSFIIFPCMVGLIIISESLVNILLTDKWLPCVKYVKILSLGYVLWPIHTANLQAINALGRSDIFLKLESLKKIVGLIILVISMKYGIDGIAWGMVISGIVSSFINSYPNKKLLNYSYLEQVQDIIPCVLLSISMGGFIYVIKFIKLEPFMTMCLQIILGIIVYILLSNICKVECYKYILNIIKNMRRKD